MAVGKTLNELRFDLLNTLNILSDDADFDYRLIDEFIINKRVKHFQNTFNKMTSVIPDAYYQNLACLPMMLVDSSECCTNTDCYVVRSVDKVPAIMSLSDGELIQRISPVGLESKSYTLITQFRLPYFGNSRYNKNSIAALYYNNYIYLISKDPIYYPQIEKITVRAVFRDPREAGAFLTCDDQPCWTAEDTFPIEERLWEWMKTDILATDFRLKITIPMDNEPDNMQNTTDLTPDGGTKKG